MEMFVCIVLLGIFVDVLLAVDLDYDDPATVRPKTEFDFEPVNPLVNRTTEMTIRPNIQCEDFLTYSHDCTQEANSIYDLNLSRPPMSDKIEDWCSALQIINRCAVAWNSDCKDMDDHSFNEETVKGQQHIISSICQNSDYLDRYTKMSTCINATSTAWEACYVVFTNQTGKHKNTSVHWTHYKTHFHLCCSRAAFRKCTLEALLHSQGNCLSEEILLMQKFSVILSAGEVFQDCTQNMMYSNCPGGDPRPMLASQSKFNPNLNQHKAVNEVVHKTHNACPVRVYSSSYLLLVMIYYEL